MMRLKKELCWLVMALGGFVVFAAGRVIYGVLTGDVWSSGRDDLSGVALFVVVGAVGAAMIGFGYKLGRRWALW